MTYQEMINEVAKKTGLSLADAKRAVVAVREVAVDAAASDPAGVAYAGFGVFKVAEVPARVGRNPHTGEQIDIPARRKLTFKPSASVKRVLNGDN